MNKNYDVIVIGAGPAGLAAAIEAKKNGTKKVLVIERNDEPGGILPQCIHNGFGSVIFKKDLPGPQYAHNFIEQAKDAGVEFLFDTMVLDITPEKKVYATNYQGFSEFDAKAVVLAMGCRERTRGQIRLPGDRPAGVFTAGMVQRFVNIEGLMPGKKFVILGSGDIGMIMARRLTLEGAEVLKVLELMPYLTGLRRNYVQCLQDFSIPLELSTTIKNITGKKRLEAIETVKVDSSFKEIPGTEETIECDSLMLSIGLIPENELSKKAGVSIDPLTGGPFINENMETNVPGIFAAGNVVTIYDLVDYVSMAGSVAGRAAAKYSKTEIPNTEYQVKSKKEDKNIKLLPGDDIRSVVPQFINIDADPENKVLVEMRVKKEFPERISVDIKAGNEVIFSKKEKYARPAEMITLKVDWAKVREKIPGSCEELIININEIM